MSLKTKVPYFDAVRSISVCGLVLCGLGLAACGRSRPDFGTMPRVEIPIEKQPEQDPTLFQEDDKEKEEEEPVTTDPPDPKPLRMVDQIDYALRFNKGELEVVSVESVQLDAPRSTPRKIGRFAFELWTGAQLIERLRFDFPLLAASDRDGEDVIESGLVSSTTIRIPATARATSARILDRKTRKVVSIPWPPQTSSSPQSP
jgi:hypothetical protein